MAPVRFTRCQGERAGVADVADLPVTLGPLDRLDLPHPRGEEDRDQAHDGHSEPASGERRHRLLNEVVGQHGEHHRQRDDPRTRCEVEPVPAGEHQENTSTGQCHRYSG